MDDLEFDEKSVVDTPLIEFNNDDMNELELDDNLLDEIVIFFLLSSNSTHN